MAQLQGHGGRTDGGGGAGDAVLRPGRRVRRTAGPDPEPRPRLRPHDRSHVGPTTGSDGPSVAGTVRARPPART
uniref:Uncharacterized protein n=1 Tax=Streptomyces ambofaciens (strain ATCC 23877 / 3486 / DSM 40053 / JCM 4204 / NBRC 12836 / NRRL B-2516) TaxID=278992 RepID=A3KK02_STRA7|nr:conserved hypothetical protein [Streptomyces ambofaciens ATCC 23877]